MLSFFFIREKFRHFYGFICAALILLLKSLYWFCTTIYDFLIYHLSHFWIEVFYFIFVSFFGFLILGALKPRTYPSKPRALDMFFTSVSSTTISSMSTVEMEVFSNAQLIIMTILMFIGGEVFTSMIGLHFISSKLKYIPHKARSRVNSVASLPLPIEGFNFDQIELGNISRTQSTNNISLAKPKSEIDFLVKSKSIKVLGFVVLAYLVVVHVLGVSMVLVYISVTSNNNAKKVLENKGLKTLTFSIFTIVSTFASCGFIPTNENMIVFRRNSGLLLILIPQILLGNTLFPSFLRLSIWVLGKFAKEEETDYLLRNTKEVRYHHWLPSQHSKLLVVTVLGFILIQFVLFCSMEWNLQGLNDLNVYQKVVGILFQVVNSRHTGESIVDISTIASAILVVFVVMMLVLFSCISNHSIHDFSIIKELRQSQYYFFIRDISELLYIISSCAYYSLNSKLTTIILFLSWLLNRYLPPYTSFLPKKEEQEDNEHLQNVFNKKGNKINLDKILFSQLSYLVIFVTIICIIERKKIKEDPLNFNVLNIVVEVISAYGNVGFSTGYSCGRQLKPDEKCVDKWYGFVGRWSDEGKIVLIIVMFFGRLKKFNMRGGKAWKLL